MVGFSQYPHTITSTVQAVQVEPYQDANGDWVIPAPGATVSLSSECRAKPNDQGKTVNGEDGIILAFSYLVYLPLTSPVFNVGASVAIGTFGSGTVKRFFRGQLNCMLWV